MVTSQKVRMHYRESRQQYPLHISHLVNCSRLPAGTCKLDLLPIPINIRLYIQAIFSLNAKTAMLQKQILTHILGDCPGLKPRSGLGNKTLDCDIAMSSSDVAVQLWTVAWALQVAEK